MSHHDYLVEMTFPPFGTLPSPAEAVSFNERLVLPTLEALQQLEASGRIRAGGTALAAVGFSFVFRAASPEELEQTLGALPLWPRAQTRVLPLGSFAARAQTARQRLQQLQQRLAAEAAPVPQRN